MKPYYQDEWVTIYHGDCREILPTLEKVDLVITSPPYNKRGTSGGLVGSVDYFDSMPEEDYQRWQVEVLNLCYNNLGIKA